MLSVEEDLRAVLFIQLLFMKILLAMFPLVQKFIQHQGTNES